MNITKISECSNCSGKKKKEKTPGYTWMPKDKTHSGKMDTQMYPECEGTKYDRNIAKKHRKAQVESQDHYCSKCGASMGMMNEQQWREKGESCDACSGKLIKTPTAPVSPVSNMNNVSKQAFNLSNYVEAKKKAKKKSPKEHGFIDQCIKEHPDVDNPGAYCASIVDKVKGTTKWRKGPKKD